MRPRRARNQSQRATGRSWQSKERGKMRLSVTEQRVQNGCSRCSWCPDMYKKLNRRVRERKGRLAQSVDKHVCTPSLYGVLSWHHCSRPIISWWLVCASYGGLPKTVWSTGNGTFRPPHVGSMAAALLLLGHESQAQTLVTGTGPGTLAGAGLLHDCPTWQLLRPAN